MQSPEWQLKLASSKISRFLSLESGLRSYFAYYSRLMGSPGNSYLPVHISASKEYPHIIFSYLYLVL